MQSTKEKCVNVNIDTQHAWIFNTGPDHMNTDLPLALYLGGYQRLRHLPLGSLSAPHEYGSCLAVVSYILVVLIYDVTGDV